MGASNFNIRAKGTSMEDAYNNVVSEYKAEFGNHFYNGTITTTSGFVDMSHASIHLTEDQFEKQALENTNKWGHCWGMKVGHNEYKFVGWAAE